MNEYSIGVHIIVKDEAEWLAQCLESVHGADEIIVIDTGSQDSSVSIAQSYGAHVINMEWDDDFSKPRNEALRHAHTEWVLVLDADERLLTPFDTVVKQLKKIEPHIRALTVTIQNWVSMEPENWVMNQALRLFRNDVDYQYRGRIHEQIEPSIIEKHGLPSISDSEFHMTHLGYLPQFLHNKKKISRNKALLQKSLEDHPNDPFLLYNMGVTHCQARHLEEARIYFEKSLLLIPSNLTYRATLIRDLSKINLEQNLLKQVDILLIPELERYQDYPDLHFLLGQSLERQGLLERAYDAYQNATTCTSGICNPSYVTEMGVATYLPLCQMGMIAQRLDNIEDAARLFHQSLQYNSFHLPALKGISSSFQRLDVPHEDIHSLLHQLLSPKTATDHISIIEALKEIHAHKEIASYKQESLLSEPEILLAVSASLIFTSRLDEVSTLFNQYISQLSYEDLNVACRLWAICQWNQNPGELQDPFYAAMPLQMCKNYEFIDQLLQIPTDTTEHHYPIDIHDLITQLVTQCVVLNQLDMAKRFIEHFPSSKLTYAKSLYLQGDTMTAADIFLTLAEQDLLDTEGSFYLGEILIDKGHYSQAAEWFEQLLQSNPRNENMITAISICYLYMAKSYIMEAIDLADHLRSSPLAEDLRSIHAAILLLNRTGWHTKRNLVVQQEVTHE